MKKCPKLFVGMLQLSTALRRKFQRDTSRRRYLVRLRLLISLCRPQRVMGLVGVTYASHEIDSCEGLWTYACGAFLIQVAAS